jgi:hypothetical protein
MIARGRAIELENSYSKSVSGACLIVGHVDSDFDVEPNSIVGDNRPFSSASSIEVHNVMVCEYFDIGVDIRIVAVELIGEVTDGVGSVGHDRTHDFDPTISWQRPYIRDPIVRSDGLVCSAIVELLDCIVEHLVDGLDSDPERFRVVLRAVLGQFL